MDLKDFEKMAPGAIPDALDAVQILKLKGAAIESKDFRLEPQLAAIEWVLNSLHFSNVQGFLIYRQQVKEAVLSFYPETERWVLESVLESGSPTLLTLWERSFTPREAAVGIISQAGCSLTPTDSKHLSFDYFPGGSESLEGITLLNWKAT